MLNIFLKTVELNLVKAYLKLPQLPLSIRQKINNNYGLVLLLFSSAGLIFCWNDWKSSRYLVTLSDYLHTSSRPLVADNLVIIDHRNGLFWFSFLAIIISCIGLVYGFYILISIKKDVWKLLFIGGFWLLLITFLLMLFGIAGVKISLAWLLFSTTYYYLLMSIRQFYILPPPQKAPKKRHIRSKRSSTKSSKRTIDSLR